MLTFPLGRLMAWVFVLTGLVFAGLVPARAGGSEVAGSADKFTGWWELGGYYGTDESSRGEVVLFVPIGQTASTIFFMDARGKFYEDDVQEGNLALGYRQMMASGWNFGFWGGLDVRDTTNDNTFWQASGGLEALSARWDARINGYVPITDPKSSPSAARVFLRGNNILMSGGAEVPLYGVDGEVGLLLFGNGARGAVPPSGRRTELRVYGGGFWFDDDDAAEEIAGPKARVELRIADIIATLPGSRLTLEGEYSHDDVRDDKWEVGARLRIPFGGSATSYASLTPQEQRMTEGLERDTDIITTESKEENVLDNATNVAMNAVSFASTAGEFSDAVDAGGERLIILQDGGGDIDVSGTSGQGIQEDQTVQGGSSTINYRGVNSGTVAPFTAPGDRPTIFNNSNGDALNLLGNNIHVAGFDIRNVGNGASPGRGINGGDDKNNIVIEQMNIVGTGNTDDAIHFNDNNTNIWVINNVTSTEDGSAEGVDFADNNSNIWVIGNDIETNGENAEGIDFSNGNSNVWVKDNTVVTTGEDSDPIEFDNNNSNVWVSGNTLTGEGDRTAGLSFRTGNSNIWVRENTIKTFGNDDESHGIQFGFVGLDDNNSNIWLIGNDIEILGNGSHGIFFDDFNSNVTIKDTTIRNPGAPGGNGIKFGDNNTNITIKDTTINQTPDEGILFGNNNSNVMIYHVSLTNVDDGIEFGGGNSNVMISHSTIMDTVDDGIEFGGNNTGVSIVDNVLTNIGNGGGDTSIELNGDNNTGFVITGNTLNGGGNDAIRFSTNSSGTVSNNIFNGTFGGDIIRLQGAGNAFVGTGNELNATFGGLFCNDAGGNAGTKIAFTNGAVCTP